MNGAILAEAESLARRPAATADDHGHVGGLSDKEARLASVEAELEAALRGRAAAEDLIAALRLFLEETRDTLAAERRTLAEVLEQKEHHHGRAQRFKAEVHALRRQLDERELRLHASRAVMAAAADDLERVASSQSWRIGHTLTRLARLMTFRKPGSSDGITRAIDRLRHESPPRERR